MKYKHFFITVLLLFTSYSFSQEVKEKKIIDHTVYNDWKTIKNAQTSSDGNWMSYELNPHRGDGKLFIIHNQTKKELQIPRGKEAKFSDNEKVLVYTIHPGYDTLRKLELKKVKKDKWVKDTLCVLWLDESFSKIEIPEMKKFALAKNGKYLAYTLYKESTEDNKKGKKSKKNKKTDVADTLGNRLYVLDLELNQLLDVKLKNVISFEFNEEGTQLYFMTQHQEKKKSFYKMHLFNLNEDCPRPFDDAFTRIGPVSFNKQGDVLAFMASKDTVKDMELYSLYLWNKNELEPLVMIDSTRSDIPKELTISVKSKMNFSPDGTKLFLGLKSLPVKKEKDTLLESEKAKLDVWHYQDKRLQPQQLKEQKRDEDRTLLSVFFLADRKLVVLEEDTLHVSLLERGNSDFALATSNERYSANYNWEYPWKKDYYSIDIQTGERKLVAEAMAYGSEVSADGKFFLFFKGNQYYVREIESGTDVCITCELENINWQEDINGMPFEANPMRSPGKLSAEEVLLVSEFDIWTYNYGTKSISSLTNRLGEKNNLKFKLIRLERDSMYVDLNQVVLVATDQKNFDEEVYVFNERRELIPVYKTNHMLTGFAKAENSDVLLFRQMNTRDYPDLYVTDRTFQSIEKVSNANPQQADYIWPTVEQIEWTSYNGEELGGLLYKPDNFDSTKSYPLLVYYYETYTEMKNRHYIPQPTASIIYATEYTSAGYVVFIPDIRYRPGQPGKDAYNSIMSGTDKVLELYPNIDSLRMGLQGQSWGGYQTAQLITMTNRYAAAMAGAPVSNMFSAYGGIRWASGLNRMFQYEHTQSRIGKTIWEAPELYVENSPIFHVPNIETPLLIMHNDNDGAVPWYQGIELFVAMKRLNKPVWMLNYNGDGHNLMKNVNRMDLSIRMRQFFDHFLLGKEAPKWLLEGVASIDKGKLFTE